MSQQNPIEQAVTRSTPQRDRSIPFRKTPKRHRSSRQIRISLAVLGGVSLILLTDVGSRWAIAQSVGQLPPPPSVTFGEGLPAVPVTPTPGSPAVVRPATADSPREQFLVYINGDSPLMLNQVQAIEPAALPREYEGRTVIQAGVFLDEDNARRQVERLEAQGIGANIEKITVAVAPSAIPVATATATTPIEVLPPDPLPVPTEIEFGQPPTTTAFGPSSTIIPVPVDDTLQEEVEAQGGASARYFVVIPGSRRDLDTLQEQVRRLAIDAPPEGIQATSSPLGPHVRVGPFRDRDTADNWRSYLRAFGMDARVHYRR